MEFSDQTNKGGGKLLRVTFRTVGEHQALTVASLINNKGILMANGRFSGGYWSVLLIDARNPSTITRDSVKAMRERIQPVVAALDAHVESRVFETIDGDLYCQQCFELMSQNTTDCCECPSCGANIHIGGGICSW